MQSSDKVIYEQDIAVIDQVNIEMAKPRIRHCLKETDKPKITVTD